MAKQSAAKQATTNAPMAGAAPAVSTCLTKEYLDNGAVKLPGQLYRRMGADARNQQMIPDVLSLIFVEFWQTLRQVCQWMFELFDTPSLTA